MDCPKRLHSNFSITMDPRARAHSTLSQFNNRPPKGLPPASRHMDPLTPRPTVPLPPTKSRKHSNPSVPRPIATNSRVKHTEQFHRDLHLAYVNNALERKALVPTQVSWPDQYTDYQCIGQIRRVRRPC